MRFGPTSLQVSSVLAKGLKRPKLRTDLRISEQTVAGEISYVVKNHETNSYNRYGATEYQLLSLCDGTRTAAEIAKVMYEKDPDLTTSEADVLDFFQKLPNQDRQFVVLAGAAHSVVFSNTRRQLWHVMQGWMTMPPGLSAQKV